VRIVILAFRSVSKRFVARREHTAKLRTGRVGWSLPILLIGVVLALLVAYSLPPFVAIDVGARHDTLYLDGVHDREYTAVAPSRTFAWPTGSDRLLLAEPLNPAFAMLTLTLDSWSPTPDVRQRLVAIYANEQRIDTFGDRGGTREFRTLLPASLIGSRQLLLRVEPLADRDTGAFPTVDAQSATLSGARTYRWTTDRATVTFPALGRGEWRVEVHAAVAHPDGKPVGARLLANGIPLAELPDYGDLRRLSVLVPASVVGDGDLTLTLAANTYNDPRPLGILLEGIAITPTTASQGSALPPWSVLLPALVIALCFYWSLRWLNVHPRSAAGAGLALAALGAWALAAYRFPIGLYLPQLAALMVFSALLTPALDWFSAWLFRRLGVPLAPWLQRALVLTFLAGFWLKGGGIMFPYMRAIDVGWHMDRVRWILEGNLAAMYQPGAFSESVMPVNEWGASRPVIPYSPFYHLFATAFAIFPWPLETSANLFSALLDNSRVFLIAILARKSGLSNRVTLLAALLYAITPFTFLLHSWGNVPTTFGIWWTLVATVVIVAFYERLDRRGPFLLLTAVLLGCMLFYTVMAAFQVWFVVLFALVVLLLSKRVERRPLRALALATGLAIVLSVAIYYGQYIPGMIERTLPYMATVFTRGPQSVGVERPPFSDYLSSYIPHLDYRIWPGDFLYYGIAIPLVFVVPGLMALRRRQLLWAALVAWFGVALLFLLVGYRISMVDKQVFYAFPAVCICWAIYAGRYWRGGRWGRLLVVAIYAFTLAAALDQWVLRIASSPVV
jgi:hypothetical protein